MAPKSVCDFVITQTIKHGVYLGLDHLGRDVVIKTISTDRGSITDLDWSRRLIHKKLLRAWSVVTPTACSVSNMMVMYEPCMYSLEEYMKNRDTGYCVEKCIGWINDLLEGTVFLHSQKLVHLNIGMENCYIMCTQGAKLSDFTHGRISKQREDRLIDSYSLGIIANTILNSNTTYTSLLNKDLTPQEFWDYTTVGEVKCPTSDGLDIFDIDQKALFTRVIEAIREYCLSSSVPSVTVNQFLTYGHNCHRYFQTRKRKDNYLGMKKWDKDDPDSICRGIINFVNVVYYHLESTSKTLEGIIFAYRGVLWSVPPVWNKIPDFNFMFNPIDYFMESGPYLETKEEDDSPSLIDFKDELMACRVVFDKKFNGISVPEVTSGTMRVYSG